MMSLNILAILLSFAMMLTGAGGEGDVAEASRTLVLHDVSLTYNGDTVDLAPSLALGATTDGEKAVIDLGVELGDETLFPIQLGVSEAGLTALLEKSDVAARVATEAFEGLNEQLAETMEAATSQIQVQMEGENGEMMSVLFNDFIPAYTALIEAVQAPEFAAQIQADGDAAMAKIVDRGEGTAVTELIEGDNYELTAYSYTIDGAQMAELADAVYHSNEKLTALYDALFKLYGVLPEESGLNDVTSFQELLEKFNLNLRMDVDEKKSEDGSVEIADIVLTVDMSDMVRQSIEAQLEEGEELAGMPEVEPLVMNIHSAKVDEDSTAEVTCDYVIDGAGFRLNMEAVGQGDENVNMDIDMTMLEEGREQGGLKARLDAATDAATGDTDVDFDMTILEEGQELGGVQVSLDTATDEETGDSSYSLSVDFEANGSEIDFDITGAQHEDGPAENSVSVAAEGNGMDFALSFRLDVTTDAIEDKVNGHEAALVIDDLSEEGLSALGENVDEDAQSALIQAVMSLSADAEKLMADESVQQLAGLFVQASAAGYDYEDSSFDGEIEDDDYYDDYGYEEPEDDGELGFDEPEFTWIPEGWSVVDTNVDTAYDIVDITLSDEGFDNYIFAMFFEDVDNAQVTYTVAEDGSITPVEGREATVSDYGDGTVYVTVRENGVCANLSINSQDIDMETVGQLVAGLKF